MLRNLSFFKKSEKQFFNYYERENEFRRLSIVYGVGGLIFAPLFALLLFNFQGSTVYVDICMSFTVFFPLYISICWFVKSFRDSLAFFFIGHLFVVTYFSFVDLVGNNFALSHFINFYVLYTVASITIQRWWATLGYVLFTTALLIYGYNFSANPEISAETGILLILIFSSSSLLALYSRNNLVNYVQDYSEYLKKIVNKPGSGFILFKIVQKEIDILDYNLKINELFKIGEEDHIERTRLFKTFFNEKEIQSITSLDLNNTFQKQVEIKNGHSFIVLDLKIVLLDLKSDQYILCRLEDISESINQQKEIQIQEKKYRDLYYKNQAGVFTLNKFSVIIDCNEAFQTIFDNEFSINQPFFRAKEIESWSRLLLYLEEHEVYKNEKFEVSLNSGKVKTLIFNWYIDKENDLIEGTVIDITKVENASKAILLSEEKFRLIYEESNDAIFLLKDFTIIDTNRRGIQIFGLTRSKLIGNSLYSLTQKPSKFKEIEFKSIIDQLKNSKHIRFEWIFQGYAHIIESEVSIVELKVENDILYQCVIRDVTENNKNIKALESSRKNYQSILENTPEGFMLISNEKEIIFANPEILRLFNVQEKEELKIENLFDSVDQKQFNELLEKHINTKELQQKQLTFTKSDHSKIVVDVTLVKTIFGDQPTTLVILKDVSIQNKLSKEIVRAELAEETNKLLKEEIDERIKTEKLLQDQYLRTKAIFDSSEYTLLFILDLNFNLTSFNKSAEKYYNSLTNETLRSNVYFEDLFNPLFDQNKIRYFKHLLQQTIEKGSQRVEVKFVYKERKHWIELFINPIYDIEGKVYEISLVVHDITDKKKYEKELVESIHEKEILLKEIHHRVKNNLQIISSILNLQSSFVHDEKILEILQDSRNRIRSMAMIHESLYRTNDFSSINFTEYIYNISSNLMGSYRINEDQIKFSTELSEVDLPLDQAIPCGLIINELMTNAIKYAFPGDRSGQIKIYLNQKENTVYLSVEDDGIGLPEKFDIENLESLGLQLVVSLTEQLNGNLEIEKMNKTKFLITFEKTKQ